MAKNHDKFIADLIGGVFKILFGIFIFLIEFIINLFSGNRNNEEIIEKQSRGNSSPSVINNLVGRSIYQVFESIHLIMTSVNYDIIESRIIFLDSRIEDIQSQKKEISDLKFTNQLSEAVDRYKTDYYDRPFKEEQIVLLNQSKTKRSEFYALCVYNGFVNYVKKQEENISKLKTEKAKEKRREKIKEVHQLYIHTLEVTSIRSESYEEVKNKLVNYFNDIKLVQ